MCYAETETECVKCVYRILAKTVSDLSKFDLLKQYKLLYYIIILGRITLSYDHFLFETRKRKKGNCKRQSLVIRNRGFVNTRRAAVFNDARCARETISAVLFLIKLTKFAVALRLRCGFCKLIF